MRLVKYSTYGYTTSGGTLRKKKFGDKKRFLWLRNNGSTLVSQIVNAMLFTTIAFAGKYDFKTLASIFGSSYLIYLVAALLDTPIVYLARLISERRKSKFKSDMEDITTT